MVCCFATRSASFSAPYRSRVRRIAVDPWHAFPREACLQCRNAGGEHCGDRRSEGNDQSDGADAMIGNLSVCRFESIATAPIGQALMNAAIPPRTLLKLANLLTGGRHRR